MDRFLVDVVMQADLPDEVREALGTVARRLGSAAPRVRLPRLRGVPGEILARWCLRRWLAEGPRDVIPFGVLDARHLGATPSRTLSGHLDLLVGGWVYVTGGAADDVCAAADARGIRVLEDGEQRLDLPAAVGQLYTGLDALHAVALDPSLARVREALLTRCSSGDAVLLEGRPGSGRSALVRWAHAALGAPAPLFTFTAGDAEFPPEDAWLIAHEPAELSPTQRRALRERLQVLDGGPTIQSEARRTRRGRPADPAFSGIVGSSAQLVETLVEVEDQAPVGAGPAIGATVLLLGETGTGKEALAEAVHRISERRGPYVRVDLGEIPKTLVEDALFGHCRGAFSGAHEDKPGLFEQAHRGTLFLDEIGNLPVEVQEKLLRVLESGRVRRLGATAQDIPVDVRVVAATSRDLAAMLRQGEFRRDLWYRLARRKITLPPLRERPDDIAPLAIHALARAGHDTTLTDDVRAALETWRWPGNVRELLDRITSAANRAGGAPLGVEHLRLPRHNQPTVLLTARPTTAMSLDSDLMPVAFAVRLRVPAFEERPRRVRRQAILDATAGRPCDPCAVAILEERTWWGGLRELGATLRGLSPADAGPLDLPRLEQCLPEEEAATGEPLVVWMHAIWRPPSGSMGGEGRLDGVNRVYTEEAVVVGRGLRSLNELGWELDEKRRRRVRESVARVRAEVGTRPVGLLALDDLPNVSLLHLLIRQRDGRLHVVVLPGAGYGVQLQTPSDPEPRLLTPGQGAAADRCVRIDLLHGKDKILTRILVTIGLEATEEVRDLLDRGPRPGQQATQGVVGDDSRRVWRLTDAEPDAVVGVLLDYVREGRSTFAPFLAERVVRWSGTPTLHRLATYLDREDASYRLRCLSRLLELDDNREVRALARERLDLLPVEWVMRLPILVQCALWTRPLRAGRRMDERE